MSASITDKFTKASSMNGYYPRIAVVTSARQVGATILQCDDLSTWATDTAVHFSTYTVNADGTIDPATQTDWKGIVSGNNITDLTRIAGADDSGNAANDRVELNPTIGWLDDLTTGLLQTHNQNGTLKASSVGSSAIADGAVTSDKIGNKTIYSNKIRFSTNGATHVSENSNLNTPTFCQPGVYYCPSTTDAQTMTNLPVKNAFQMTVVNLLNTKTEVSTADAWTYLLRVFYGLGNSTYIQYVSVNGYGEWEYGPWLSVFNSANITITTSDPGVNSSLAADHFVAVYEA